MNNESTEDLMMRAAHRLSFGASLEEVAAALRAEGHGEEVIFLVITAATILAR